MTTAMPTGIDPGPPGVDVDHLRAVLASGMAWFYDIAQPAGALIQHHGVRLWADTDANRIVSAIPRGSSGCPVLVVDVLNVDYDANFEPTRTLGDRELEWWTGLVDDIGVGWGTFVAQSWNWTSPAGNPITTGSVALARDASRSLVGAVDRYLAGCPTHPTVRGANGRTGVFCECGWFQAGHAKLVRPHWPVRPSSVHPDSTI